MGWFYAPGFDVATRLYEQSRLPDTAQMPPLKSWLFGQ